MASSIADLLAGPDLHVLGVIDLLHCDHDLGQLRDQLAKLKRPKYLASEKIVVLHFDIEYYYLGHALGFTTHNLFAVWRELDIPYSVMVLIHNHATIDRGINHFIVDDRDQPTTVHTLVNHYSLIHVRPWIATALAPRQIAYPAMCLMGMNRSHRVVLMQYLTHHKLLDRVRTNFAVGQQNYTRASDLAKVAAVKIDHDTPANTVYSHPHRSNESVFAQCRIAELNAVFSVPVSAHQDPLLTGSFDDFYHRMFLDVVTETLFDSPHVYISEKTLRPLITGTPFIVFGASGLLSQLRDQGFKTFGDFWDESYDSQPDPHLRFLICCRILEEIASLPITQLAEMHTKMQPILVHNRKTMIDYIQCQYRPLYHKLGLNDTDPKSHSS